MLTFEVWTGPCSSTTRRTVWELQPGWPCFCYQDWFLLLGSGKRLFVCPVVMEAWWRGSRWIFQQPKYMSDQRLSLFLFSGFVALTPETERQAAVSLVVPAVPVFITKPLKAASPFTALWREALPRFWFYGNNHCSERLNCATLPFQAWNRRTRSTFVWLISQKMSAILLRLFVRSFFYLPYCSYKNVSLSWWMYRAVTTYLPALVWICCFYVLFWGRNRSPGLKKKKVTNIVEHVTYVTVDCNSLLELIKNYCFKPKYWDSLWSQVCSVAMVMSWLIGNSWKRSRLSDPVSLFQRSGLFF